MKRLLCILIGLVSVLSSCHSQDEVFLIRRKQLVLRLDNRWTKAETDSILLKYGMTEVSADSAFRFGSPGRLAREGWRVRKKNAHIVEVYKSVHQEEEIPWEELPMVFGEDIAPFSGEENAFNDRVFGYNRFIQPSVIEMSDGITVFHLRGFKQAKQVVLSGSFNGWSTHELMMASDADGWTASLRLPPGRHEYKFIVDGRWMRDPDNEQKIPDNAGEYNSVYFKTNYTFRLKAEEGRKTVVLTGNFNGWDEKSDKMIRSGDDFILDVFLPNGTWFYKFIADGNWMTDPKNPQVKTDADGYTNSYISLGESAEIFLSGYTNAGKVVLSGSFNEWNETNLTMEKQADGWKASVALSPGLYEYRFIVDGKWITDPAQPTLPNEYNERNNYLVFRANYTFSTVLPTDVKEAWITGSFCDWRLPGIPLQKKEGTWTAELWLPSEKTTYKINADGKLILDPANSLWEENEFQTGNSLIWRQN